MPESPKPLKMRREVGRAPTPLPAEHGPIAKLWVDTGVFHLDDTFDYFIPEKLSDQIEMGIRVEVEFGSSIREAIVVERISGSALTSKVKPILKVLSPHPIATDETLNLIQRCSERWAGTPYDILRSAVPARIGLIDKEIFTKETSLDLPKKTLRSFITPSFGTSLAETVLEILHDSQGTGQILIICSDEKELTDIYEKVSAHFHNAVRLDGHLARAERYRNFLSMAKGVANIGIGLRGAIFTPLTQGSTLIVTNDSSEHLYETRSPGWNARDVAILRSAYSGMSLYFIGYSPSLEIARLIEIDWMKARTKRSNVKVSAQAQERGSLLPSKLFGIVRKALLTGPVLFLVPRKGYGNAVLCSKCRNVALCECGGRLAIESATSSPTCSICQRKYPEWRCSYCQSREIYVAARGIDRFVEEIGRAFPKYKIVNSSGAHILSTVTHDHTLVVATPGAEPRVNGGYSAVAILEGDRFLGHSDLRAGERMRNQFFSAANLTAKDGEIFLAIDSVNPIVAALTKWDSTTLVRRELSENQEVHLSPFYRYVSIEIESSQASPIRRGLDEAIRNERIPLSTTIHGPHEIAANLSRITIAVEINEAGKLVNFIHELQRRRSIAHKSLMKIRVDPYSLD